LILTYGALIGLLASLVPVASGEEQVLPRPGVRVTDCAMTQTGEWVFRLRLEAKGGKPVDLTGELQGTEKEEGGGFGPFSLDAAVLVDPESGAEEAALPLLPRTKIADPMQVQSVLLPGGWISLAVGFARLPEAATADDGKAPRLLEIRCPGFSMPVKFRLNPKTEKIKSQPGQ
jgi:hypothetical protein